MELKMKFLILFSIFIIVSCEENSTSTTTSTVPPSTTATIVTEVISSTSTELPSTTTEKPFINSSNVLDLRFVFQKCDYDCDEDEMTIYDYYYGEGLERCGVNGGLLCIANDNLKNIRPNWKGQNFKEYSKYQWNSLKPNIDTNSSNEIYKKGDNLIIFHSHSESSTHLKLPSSLTGTSDCLFMENIKFLETKSIKCLRTINEACVISKKIIQQFVENKVLEFPQKLSDSTKDDMKFVNVSIELCRSTNENCTKIDKNNEESLIAYEETCIDDININFYTNSSKLANITIMLSSSNEEIACDSEDGSRKIIQTIKINFEEFNKTKTKFIKRKQRGYNDDDTLLISRYRLINESDPNSGKVYDLYRNGSTITEDDLRMKIPNSRNGKCSLIDEIRFNENSLIKCAVELNTDLIVNQSICQHYQFQVINFLLPSMNVTANYSNENYNSDIFVSQKWFPFEDKKYWTKLNIKNIPLWEPEQHGNDTKNITCMKFPNKINYKIYSSKIFSKNGKKFENVIKNFHVEFGTLNEIYFNNENSTSKVNIEMKIQFFDDEISTNESVKLSNQILLILLMNCIVFYSIFTK